MSNRLAPSPTPPALQAANVLRAWITCDEVAFRCEIGKTLELCSVRATAGEEEQVELLKAVAGSLSEAPLGSVSSSLVHVCIDLLAHLSDQFRTEPRVSPGSCEAID